MPWTALFAVMALLGLQLAIAAASLYAYNRIRGKEDAAGQEKLTWGIRIEAANSAADSAKRLVETMEVEHFKRLRALFEAQAAELAESRARITSLEKELKVCQMKLASEERIERRITKGKAAKAEPDEEEEDHVKGNGQPKQLELQELIRAHGVPLTHQPAGGPAEPSPKNFGKIAR